MEGGRNDLGFGVRCCNAEFFFFLSFFLFFSFLLSFYFMGGLCMSASINI